MLKQQLVVALRSYLIAYAMEEARKPPDEYQLRRAAAAKEWWLASGLIKLPPKFPK